MSLYSTSSGSVFRPIEAPPDIYEHPRHDRLQKDQHHERGDIDAPGSRDDSPYGNNQRVRDLDDGLRKGVVEVSLDPLQDETKQKRQQIEICQSLDYEYEWIAHVEWSALAAFEQRYHGVAVEFFTYVGLRLRFSAASGRRSLFRCERWCCPPGSRFPDRRTCPWRACP